MRDPSLASELALVDALLACAVALPPRPRQKQPHNARPHPTLHFTECGDE